MVRSEKGDASGTGMSASPAGKLLGALYAPPERLAPFAVRPALSRGRLYREKESETRTCYSRDRDRILHSSCFRRLMHKTQVFFDGEGDYFRTRLTHSLEVAQIARTFARVLAVDEDLTETIALAHDIGHTPFGHLGEEVLSECAAAIGGFDHNAHALRLVVKLEHRYADFDGLNLTWESLEGLVKHNGPLVSGPGEILPAPITNFDARWPLDLARWPSLEAQLAAVADDIAYLNHDIDDGLRAGMFTLEDLNEAPFAGDALRAVKKRFGTLELSRLIGELVRLLMGEMTGDLLENTRRNLKDLAPTSVEDIRQAGRPMAAFSAPIHTRSEALKKFLFYRMYRHPHVIRSREAQKVVIRDLFAIYCKDPGQLPGDWAGRCGAPSDMVTQGVVRDYIAGMTDSFAMQVHRRLCSPATLRHGRL